METRQGQTLSVRESKASMNLLQWADQVQLDFLREVESAALQNNIPELDRLLQSTSYNQYLAQAIFWGIKAAIQAGHQQLVIGLLKVHSLKNFFWDAICF